MSGSPVSSVMAMGTVAGYSPERGRNSWALDLMPSLTNAPAILIDIADYGDRLQAQLAAHPAQATEGSVCDC